MVHMVGDPGPPGQALRTPVNLLQFNDLRFSERVTLL